ncbi:MAG: MiaB/RimO family radical SAM methylthiotransferase [bacterium]
MRESNSSISFYPLSLGCVKNQTDFEYLAGALSRYNWSMTEDPSSADVIIINTCSFIEDAREESIEEIFTFVSEKPVIVTGCLFQRYPGITEEIPEVKIFAGIEPARFAGDIDSAFRNNEAVSLIESDTVYCEQEKREPFSRYHTYIKISEGCDRRCSFCAIPSIRGRYRSRETGNIIKEVRRLYSEGFREFNLISEDTSLYGSDSGKTDITGLIRKLNEIGLEGIWFRLLYVYPGHNIEDIVKAIADSEHFINYIDVPFQHVSSRILKLMNRQPVDVPGISRMIKDKGLTLRSTLMTGFPTETEGEFNAMADFVAQSYIDKLGLFRYCDEENTPAEQLEGKIDNNIKNRRLETLLDIQEEIAYENMMKNKGRIVRAVFHEKAGESYMGRLLEDMYETDELLLSRSEGIVLHRPVDIRITDIDNMAYIGILKGE